MYYVENHFDDAPRGNAGCVAAAGVARVAVEMGPIRMPPSFQAATEIMTCVTKAHHVMFERTEAEQGLKVKIADTPLSL